MISRILALFVFVGTAFAQTPTPPAVAPIDVWPEGKMPGHGADSPETEIPSKDGFHRATNVSRPTLTLFLAPRKAGPSTGSGPLPAMIVCPGGAYHHTVIDKEGSEVAAWLNSVGVSALVLKYRTPNNRSGALQDAQRALSLVRERAAEWNIDPKRLGMIGFSAGGNLTAKTSAPMEERSYPAIDAIDRQSCRPDFAVLVYPAYLNKGDGVASDLNLKASIPPTLILHNEDDKSYVVGSKAYDAALTAANVPHEFHLYPTGGHGYGLHCQGDARAWPDDALKWLQKTVPQFGK